MYRYRLAQYGRIGNSPLVRQRAYKSEKRAEEKLKGRDGLEFLETLSKQVQWSCDGRYSY